MSLVSELVSGIKANLRVCLPCKVDQFYAADQTVDLVPLSKDFKNDGTYVNIPMLCGVPVQFPGGSTFPVIKGDEGVVVFADKSIDEWVANGAAMDPTDPRSHHLSDGLFLPGFRSTPNKLTQFDESRSVTKAPQGSVAVAITKDVVHLGVGHGVSATESVVLGDAQKSAMDSFITALSNALLTVLSTGVSPTGPVQFAGLAALSTAIDAAKASYDSQPFLSSKVKAV